LDIHTPQKKEARPGFYATHNNPASIACQCRLRVLDHLQVVGYQGFRSPAGLATCFLKQDMG
jgi:hypothetical protein